jgi:hypothetical protein
VTVEDPPSTLLGSTVRVGDIRVGIVSAVLVNAADGRAFGLEVAAQGGDRWFLPCVAADLDGCNLRATSALFFGGPDQLDAYVRRGAHVVRRRGGEDPGAGVLARSDGGTSMP